MNFKGFRFLQCLAVLLLVIFNQSCIPPSIGTEWKDYSKRYHVCFKDIVPGRTYNASHKFLYKTTFDVGTIFKVRGDFDPLDGAELPNDVFWTFEHVRKGNQLFQQSFTVPLNDKGKFSTFGAELTSRLTFEKNDIVRWGYSGIDVPHDTDIRINISFPETTD